MRWSVPFDTDPLFIPSIITQLRNMKAKIVQLIYDTEKDYISLNEFDKINFRYNNQIPISQYTYRNDILPNCIVAVFDIIDKLDKRLIINII